MQKFSFAWERAAADKGGGEAELWRGRAEANIGNEKLFLLRKVKDSDWNSHKNV